MTTRELIKSLPDNIQDRIKDIRDEYRKAKNRFGTLAVEDKYNMMVNGYCKGLYDAGVITDRERSMIYIYMKTFIDD